MMAAEDTHTDAAIAAACGVEKRAIDRWKHHPDFRTRVAEHVAAFVAAIQGRGIADRQNRVDALNERWSKMRDVITARSGDEDMRRVPGGKTGLLTKQYKQVGSGRDAQLVTEYSVDTGLLKELREHEKQAAQELGQWIEKQDTTSGGAPLTFTIAIDRNEPHGDEGTGE